MFVSVIQKIDDHPRMTWEQMSRADENCWYAQRKSVSCQA